jgi:ACS family hexuronate transporter-like MFS transporter
MYRKPELHSRLSASELAYIQADGIEPTERIPWARLLPHRETLTVCLLKFVTDPVWWFFLFWLPKFLHDRYAVSLLDLGPPLVVIYIVSDMGSVAGGWLSSHLIGRGWTVDAARKTTILLFGLLALPIFLASRTASLWTAVALISLGTAAHQAVSSNIYTIVSDVFPRRSVGSVIGLAGMSGAIAAALVSELVGFILTATGSYTLIFGLFSVAYVVAWVILRIGIPVIRPIRI